MNDIKKILIPLPAGILLLILMGLCAWITPVVAAGKSNNSPVTQESKSSNRSAKNTAEAKALANKLGKELDSLPRWAGWVLLALGFVPLFWGWRFLRTVVSIFFAIAFARVAYSLTVNHVGPMGALVASMVASMIGGSLGWYVRAMLMSVEGAIVLGGSLFSLGVYLGSSDLGLGFGAFGAVTGLYLGFKYAPYLEAVEAALIGATVIGMGMAVLRPGNTPQQTTYIVVGAALAAAAASIYYQFKHIPEWIKSGEMETQPVRRVRK